VNSHLLLMSRKRGLARSQENPQEAGEERYSLIEQISYFSVKKQYERVINSVDDYRLAS
jgi:hypothetical protein